jgi:hypothetical protein
VHLLEFERGVRAALEQERDAYGARVAERYRELEAARTRIAELERELANRRADVEPPPS